MMNFSARSVSSIVCLLFVTLFMLLFAADTFAEASNSAGDSATQKYSSGSISSIEMAEQALADVRKERERVESRFAEEEQSCDTKFFSASCHEEAKERRRSSLERLRNIENEANLYRRQARARERDDALAVKRAKEEEAGTEQKRSIKAEPHNPKPDAAPKPSAANQADRVAKHERKMRQLQAEEAANAQKRAENIEAYQRKVDEARAHQQEVERRKAEKKQSHSPESAK